MRFFIWKTDPYPLLPERRIRFMYIHLGEQITVHDHDVIGIFDLENTTIGPDTRGLLNRLEQQKRVVNITNEMPKSFVLCKDGKLGEIAYVSPISAATLRKRAVKLF